MHVFGVVEDPPEQVYPGAGPEQSPRQLVVDKRSPSSQNSPIMFFPSPQIGVQVFGLTKVLHVYPVSIKQTFEQPSFEFVFPSSQPSDSVLIPSPHVVVQVYGVELVPPAQVYPVTGPEQSDLQFVAPLTSPSSHSPTFTFLPSPQIGVHVFGIGKLEHVHPGSTRHKFEQPSVGIVLPSSHCSLEVMIESPQT